MEHGGLQAQCPPQQSLSGSLCPSLCPQCGAGLAGCGMALAAWHRGSARGWGRAVPLLTPVISAIYSEVYFLYQMPSPADGCPLGEEALLLCPGCLLHGQQPFRVVGQHAAAPSPVPRGMPVPLGWGTGTGVGWGWCYFALLFAAGAGWGDYFLSGQREACQMRVRLITLF